MVDAYGTGRTSAGDHTWRDTGASQRSHLSHRTGSSEYERHIANTNMSGRGHDFGEDYDRHRTSSSYSDTVLPLIGAALGGLLGYMLPGMLKSERSHAVQSRGYGAQRSGYGQDYGAAPSYRSGTRSSGSVEMDETTDLIASNKVEGTTVYNHQGEQLGEVYNFMVGKRSGRVAYAVMSFGGLLGIGQRYHALPWNVLTYDTSKGGYVINATKDQLMSAPSHAAGEEPFSQPGHMRNVREFWAQSQLSL